MKQGTQTVPEAVSLIAAAAAMISAMVVEAAVGCRRHGQLTAPLWRRIL